MKKNLLRGIFCLVSLTIVFLVNAQSPTAPAQSFNIFLKNGAKLVTNETEGPIALGGDLEVAGNYQVNIHNNGTFTAGNIPIGLLVGGKLTLTSGSLQVNNGRYVKIGNCAASNVKVWYRDNNNAASNIYVTTASGSYASTPNININSNCLSWGSPEVSASNKPICDANTASLIDFNAAFTSFQANSLSLSSCSTTGVDLTNPNGNVHGTTITSVLTGGQLKINLGSGTNVLNCTGAELNSVTNGITFNTQPDASHVLVINVNASGSFTWNVWNQAGIGSSNASYIIYNFYNCTSLNIAGNSTIEGTVFAPLADITKTVNQSNIEGQVIGLSFYQSGGEVHYYPFTPSVTGCSPSCTTPATPTVSITQPTCATATGTITVTAPTGAGYTYSIDGTTYQSSTVFSGINAGSYNVTAKSGTCVSIATTAVVNAQPTAPSTPVVSITQPTCSVATGTITVTSPTGAGYTYSIDGTTYQSGVTFSNVASGTYTVYVKNAGGCITSLANTIINAAPSAPAAPAVSITQPTCSVATGTITVTSPTGAGYTYSIDGTTYQSSVTFTNVATGNYTVYVKNAGGCSNTASATINAQPVTPTVASITGSNTVCIGGTTALTDVTAGGVWSTSDATIATIDNTGIVAGVAAGSVTITYTVSNACGTAFKTLLMSVTDCSVNGGGSGGLESKSLGDAVAKRMYNKAVNNQLGAVDYGKLPSPQVQTGNIRTFGSGGLLKLSDILPAQLTNNSLHYTSYITTPTDIPSITNATDVYSIDYTLNNEAKAVSFATLTSGGVYDHTKAICDRLKGSVLTDMQNIMVNGMKMISYTLKTPQGNTEYAMSFVVGAKNGRNSYVVQSTWLNEDYTSDETMYNIQLWAISADIVANMASQILSRFGSDKPLQLQPGKALPQTYITAGNRDKTQLNLSVNNKQTVTSGYFIIQDRLNENAATVTSRTVPFTVTANGLSNISVPMGDTYESTISLYINNQLQDEVFMADGSWSYGTGPNTTVYNFNVTNDASRTYTSDEYPVFRNVQLLGNTADFISVFKLLKGGGSPVDLSGYKSLKFTSNAGMNIRITLVKNSIANWSDQYTTVVTVDKGTKEYTVPISAFQSSGSSDKLNANDVTTVMFAMESGTGRSTAVNAVLQSVSFTKQDAGGGSSSSSVAKEIRLYPNPIVGSSFSCTFRSDKDMLLNVRVLEVSTGKVAVTQQVKAIVGDNKITVDMGKTTSAGVYVLSIDGDGVQYNPTRFVLGKK